ncbi:NAD(P)-binding domain-containing protein [Thermomicrobiaceae bacterium CFH 74404]|uniref:NAD(P)-binding domain-containing protein n=1 Tax=Thermalbibacter longus TaxID=2951981 RepID=A0AA42BAX4_9BACT|nr:FAD-dependent oxidoreductase [Thermalbibacter longus]MCM8749085.1 NAD(P)-binding domain-containing protein [Thermalbibacter longus]
MANTGSNATRRSSLPVVVIGAGPVGLAAAAHLAARGQSFLLLEAQPAVGWSARQWQHVRLFSPWKYNLDPLAAELLGRTGWVAPLADAHPTGGELVEQYLEPLAAHPAIAPHLRLRHRVLAVARQGRDRLLTTGRSAAPFVVRVETPLGETDILARAVIDASGAVPNPLGASGLPAIGEEAMRHRIFYGIPDVLGQHRARYAGRRVLVVGSGHSAFNVLLDLVQLAAEEPGTSVMWAVRRDSLAGRFGGGERDELPERGRLGQRAQAIVEQGLVKLVTGFRLTRIEETPDGLVAVGEGHSLAPVDEIVAATGFRPDLAPLRELRLSLDPITEAPVELAPLIDPNVHSCGTVPPHGFKELRHPEEGFFLLGLKSYGRAPTFLMRTGYEQARSVVAALTGDWEAAERVELVLPHTGVCSGPVAADGEAACCEPAARPEPVLIRPAVRSRACC